jgi:hypothetical protein
LAGVVKVHVGTRILVIEGQDGSDVRRYLNQVRRRLTHADSQARTWLQDDSINAPSTAALEAAEAGREQVINKEQRPPEQEQPTSTIVPTSAAGMPQKSGAATSQAVQPPPESSLLRRSERQHERLQSPPFKTSHVSPRQA